ncbi:MAG: heme-dependent peroxidase, partial [bacterium]|nr:heme-dependent peroxidase [bacterium]
MQSTKPEPRTEPPAITNPATPLTLEGSSVLHQMMRVRWADWRKLSGAQREGIASEAAAAIEEWEQPGAEQSALYSLLGHKGDLLLLHFRSTFDGLNAAELKLASLRISDFLKPTTSYLSVVELGLYESSAKLYKSLDERGVKPGSAEWSEAIEETLERQRNAMKPRLWPQIPAHRYLCFYPMDRKRGESKNWYEVALP